MGLSGFLYALFVFNSIRLTLIMVYLSGDTLIDEILFDF
jgi:hypothetical protein